MADDVVLNKAAIVERCVRRVREVHAGDDANILRDPTRQDSIVLNLQRACEACVDLAMHLVRRERLGLPQETREAFQLLEEADLLPPDLARSMRAMVGFRNVAVHSYRELDLEVVRSLVHERLPDFEASPPTSCAGTQGVEDEPAAASQPVLRRPAEMPVTVSSRAASRRLLPRPRRLRRMSSTWM